jgi:hypothetical protein
MTEDQWLTSTDPKAMLEFLGPKANRRKLRWFAIGCCRLMSDNLHQYLLDELDLAEEFIAGKVTRQKLSRKHYHRASRGGYFVEEAAVAAALAPQERIFWGAGYASSKATLCRPVRIIQDEKSPRYAEVHEAEKARHGALLRCVFGNPFRPVAVNPAWLAWNDATVRHLAESIHRERAFDRLPILADALEEAGCDNADILDHLRGPGPHVRGCWVLDLLLDRK